jgi:hypothetical protein
VSEALPGDELDARVAALAEELAAGAGVAIRMTKRAINMEAREALAAAGGHAIDAGEASHLLVLSEEGAMLVETAGAGTGDLVDGLDEALELRPCPGNGLDFAPATRPSLMLAAYLTGVAQKATKMSVGYAMEREQFGQPIGAFQAIKHMCADMRVRADAADTQVFYAAITGERAGHPPAEAAAARMLANEAAIKNAMANIQVHGGMGYTAECDAHLLLKRAQVLSRFGASAARLRRDVLAA